ncbi:MAG: hypothetical protein KDD15_14840 [Lewinella sp.]|nr:hypothetical protein [Lewinella sp.]
MSIWIRVISLRRKKDRERKRTGRYLRNGGISAIGKSGFITEQDIVIDGG